VIASGRVALFLPALLGGGAERAFLSLADGFLSAGVRVDLVLASEAGPLRDEVPEGVRVVDLGSNRVLRAVRPLARYLRAVRPVGLVSALTHANLAALAAVRLARVKTAVVVVEQNNLSATQQDSAKRQTRALPALMRCFYGQARGVVAVSQGVADDLATRAGLDRASLSVVHNPLRFDLIRERAAAPLDVELPAGEAPLIVGVGSLTAQKDFPTLIEAVSRARTQRPCRAIIAGDGPERAKLEQMVMERGLGEAVKLPGFVANPYPLFAAADVFVLSSRWEGLPTVLLEALALGAPVVSTDCPNGPREILRGGELGWLVPVESPDALAAAVLEAIEQDRAGVAFDESPYRLETVVARYLNLLGLDN